VAPPDPTPDEPADSTDLLLTQDLLQRAKSGDPAALDALMARYLPRLMRWASGRLPSYARSLLDTSDLVQDTLMRTFEGLGDVEVRGPGGFQAYVRQAVLNRIRDQIRWARRRPGPDGIPEDLVDRLPSPLEEAIGSEVLERYESALQTLTAEEQQLLHLHVELDFDYAEIAAMTGKTSRDAVRMAVRRALSRLAEAMGHEQ
jgi:RNA polymerase sigma-70 factor, ECF subfamily